MKVNRTAPEPPYLQIVADLRKRIASGELQVGARVPSTREITREWGVAMATATKVLAALRQEGLVRSVPGVGTVVEARPEVPSPKYDRSRYVGGRDPTSVWTASSRSRWRSATRTGSPH